MYRKHTICRACGFGKRPIPTLKTSLAAGVEAQPESLIPVLDLGPQPLANDFRADGDEHAGFAPLKVMFCPRCTLAQLSVVVDPKILYSRYSYVTSNSATMQEHFDVIARDITEETNGRFLFEIGANDGRLIRHFQKLGFDGLGIDPAENLCRLAREQGTTVACEFFGKDTKLNACTAPDIILARHVFCHIDDWQGFMDGIENISNENTLVCIEAPYVVDQLQTKFWDQVYHEHLSYMNVRAIEHLLKRTDFHLHRIIHYPIHGGSLMLMLRHDKWSAGRQRHCSVDEYLTKENITAQDWKALDTHMRSSTRGLNSMVQHLNDSGKTVVGYGAAAKSTVWINAASLDGKLRFVCDNTPFKQWTTIPGTSIPVVDDGALTRELPDYAVCFAWNFATEIIAKEKIFREHKGKWIVPVPEISII